MIQKFLALPDKTLRWLALAFFGTTAAVSMYFHGTFLWFLTLLTLSTVMNAPKLKEAYLQSNKWLRIASFVALAVSFGAFPWLPQQYAMMIFAFGNMPVVLEMNKKIQAQMMKQMGIKPPAVKKVVAEKAPVATSDPGKKRTFTQRKDDARRARKAQKKNKQPAN